MAIDLVLKSGWAHIASAGNCAVELVQHHTRKASTGETEATTESARGAKVLTDACRSVQVINRMTKEEGDKADVENHRRVFFGSVRQAELRPAARGLGMVSTGERRPGHRYQSRCGTVYGHTGNFPGYVQWAAATADGTRSVTTTLNIPAPTGALLRQLRSVQASAVCALLRRAPAVASTPSVRTVALREGLTSVDLSLRHKPGWSPPAIVLSTTRASRRCSVTDYRYTTQQFRGRFRMRIRCPQAQRAARGRHCASVLRSGRRSP